MLRRVYLDDLESLNHAALYLMVALRFAKRGGATASLAAIRRARKSIEGAIRHAERAAHRA